MFVATIKLHNETISYEFKTKRSAIKNCNKFIDSYFSKNNVKSYSKNQWHYFRPPFKGVVASRDFYEWIDYNNPPKENFIYILEK